MTLSRTIEQRIFTLEQTVARLLGVEAEPPLPDGYLSRHFRAAEFACNHCGEMHPDADMPPAELLDFLEIIRDHFQKPVVINSGYRCATHNRNVGGARQSRHMAGDAADIMVAGVAPSVVYAFCDDLIGDRGGVGRYNTFTHIDVRGHRARW